MPVVLRDASTPQIEPTGATVIVRKRRPVPYDEEILDILFPPSGHGGDKRADAAGRDSQLNRECLYLRPAIERRKSGRIISYAITDSAEIGHNIFCGHAGRDRGRRWRWSWGIWSYARRWRGIPTR